MLVEEGDHDSFKNTVLEKLDERNCGITFQLPFNCCFMLYMKYSSTDLIAISLNLYCKMVQMGSASVRLLCHINIEQCTELSNMINGILYN